MPVELSKNSKTDIAPGPSSLPEKASTSADNVHRLLHHLPLRGESSTSFREKLTPEDQKKVEEYYKRGNQFKNQKDYKSAFIEFKNILEIKAGTFGIEHRNMAPDLYNIGTVCLDLGKLEQQVDEREKMFKHAENFLLEALKRDPDGKNTPYQLGILYQEWGKNDDANEMLLKAYRKHQRGFLGNSSPVDLLHRLAISSLKGGELGRAEEFALKALGKSDYHDPTEIQHLLGDINLKLGKYEDAKRYASQAIDSEKKKLQPNDFAMANSYLRLGIACDKLGKGEEANKCFEEMFSLRRDVLELEYPENRSHVDHLIKFYKKRNDNEKTELLLAEALVLSEKKLNFESARKDLNNLATFYEEQGQSERAERVWKEAFDRRKIKIQHCHDEAKRLAWHDEAWHCLEDGATFFLKRNKPELAKKWHRDAVAWREIPTSICSSALETIGNTPVLPLQKVVPSDSARVLVKLEMRNPTGSYKDRMARPIIEKAEERGELRSGMTVMEATAGSTGTALSFVCARKGYPFNAVTSEEYAPEKLRAMKAFGGDLTLVESSQDMPLMSTIRKKAGELAQEPNIYYTDQFSNKDAFKGYKRFVEELLAQVDGPIDAFCVAAGTTGMVMGVAKALHEANSQAQIIVLEPASSPVISGGKPGSHQIEGVGAGFVPQLFDKAYYDRVIAIDEKEAFKMARRLAKEEGIFAGASTGLNVAGALRVAQELGPGRTVVTVAVDTGYKYLSGNLYREAED